MAGWRSWNGEAIKRDAEKAAIKHLNEVGEVAYSLARSRAPVDTGEYKSKIEIMQKPSRKKLVLRLGSSALHAVFVEQRYRTLRDALRDAVKIVNRRRRRWGRLGRVG